MAGPEFQLHLEMENRNRSEPNNPELFHPIRVQSITPSFFPQGLELRKCRRGRARTLDAPTTDKKTMTKQSFDPKNIRADANEPPVFKSVIEEVCAGSMTGALLGGVAVLILAGILGRVGEKLSESAGFSGTLGGCIVIWTLYLLLPLLLMLKRRNWLLIAVFSLVGAAYLWGLHLRIDRKDIGIFYPWILSALPFGICLGTFFEPIRLARGGNADEYKDKPRVFVSSSLIYLGKHNQLTMIATVLADIVSALNRQRPGAVLAGALGGGLVAGLFGALVAWRGDATVADLFGSSWNIAYMAAGLGILSGGFAGFFSWSIFSER
jgi:hypothetical protein